MRVAIAGAGAVGRSIASELLDNGHEVLLIDKSPRSIAVDSVPRAEWLLADACEITSLDEAALERCNVVIAATGDDKANLVVSLLAKTEYGVPRVVRDLLPAPGGHGRPAHQRVADQALADLDHLVGTVPEQPGHTARGYREPDPRPPAKARLIAGQRLDRDIALQAGDAPQLMRDHLRLEPPLRFQAGVLPVAAPAGTWPGVRAGRLDPVRRGLHDLDRLGPRELGGGIGNPRADPFAGQRVAHEHDPAAGLPRHTPAAVRDIADRQLDQALLASAGRPAGGVRDPSFHVSPMPVAPSMPAWGRATFRGALRWAGTVVTGGRPCTS